MTEKLYFEFEGQKEDYDWELKNDLLEITCYHDVFKAAFGSFTKRFQFFYQMIDDGRKVDPVFFNAMLAASKTSLKGLGKLPQI
jgi:hypothetical protein